MKRKKQLVVVERETRFSRFLKRNVSERYGVCEVQEVKRKDVKGLGCSFCDLFGGHKEEEDNRVFVEKKKEAQQ